MSSVAEGLPDIIAGQLDVLFCGINPGLTAAVQGQHFAGRGNRFWRTLHLAGFTPEELSPQEDRRILHYGCGLTAVVDRPTARADQLSLAEFKAASVAFEGKIRRHKPRCVAFLGKAGWAGLSGRKALDWGRQEQRFGDAVVWLLPNPSGRNLAFSLEQLVSAYRELRLWIESGQL